MQFLVVGAGAVGTYIGAFLGRSGQLVSIIGRPPVVEALNRRERGLQVVMPNGSTWHTQNYRAVASFEDACVSSGLFGPPYDAILLCVKAYDVREVVRELSNRSGNLCYAHGDPVGRTAYLCFQNGVGSEGIVAQEFGAESVLAATTTNPLTVPEPGVARLEQTRGAVCIAPLKSTSRVIPDTSYSRQRELLLISLKGAFFDLHRMTDGRALKWSKMLLNMMGNATSAILDLPPADIYGNRLLFSYEMSALREAVCVVRSLGLRAVNLPGYPARILSWAVRFVPNDVLKPILSRQVALGRGGKWPSFYYDVHNQKHQCEVDWLNGAVVRYGKRTGVPTPVNKHLVEVLRGLVQGSENPEEWNGQVEKLLKGPN